MGLTTRPPSTGRAPCAVRVTEHSIRADRAALSSHSSWLSNPQHKRQRRRARALPLCRFVQPVTDRNCWNTTFYLLDFFAADFLAAAFFGAFAATGAFFAAFFAGA